MNVNSHNTGLAFKDIQWAPLTFTNNFAKEKIKEKRLYNYQKLIPQRDLTGKKEGKRFDIVVYGDEVASIVNAENNVEKAKENIIKAEDKLLTSQMKLVKAQKAVLEKHGFTLA